MSVGNNEQGDGDNSLSRRRVDFTGPREQIASSRLPSPSRPTLAIDTAPDPSPHGANVPPLDDSDSTPGTSNPINRSSRRHSRRVKWASNTTSVTVPPDALRVYQEDETSHTLSSLDELALDAGPFYYSVYLFY
jgi:hypothetical protein